jgi:hypothetical protein
MPTAEYAPRTQRNVAESDGTLVLTRGKPRGGTALTIGMARRWRKPCLVVDLNEPSAAGTIKTWAAGHRIQVLNVAGPRESDKPGVYERAVEFLHELLGESAGRAPVPSDGE